MNNRIGEEQNGIGKYNFIKDVGKLMSYIGNVHPNVGKYHGKILGLVWDFFCPQNTDFMLGIQHKKLGMFIPILKISWENAGPSVGFFWSPKY